MNIFTNTINVNMMTRYNEIYLSLKKGDDMSFNAVIDGKDCFYRYSSESKIYFKYSNDVPSEMININRNELIKILGDYLRKIKLEKICSKLEIK